MRVSVYKDGAEKAFVTFGGSDNKTSWFAPSNILDSSYTYLSGDAGDYNYFSMAG